MSIGTSSGVKFFGDSQALFRDGVTNVASSGALAQDYILNFNKAFVWESIGSDDSTTETLTITFPTSQTIDRLFLINHNWNKFGVTYNGGNDFSNVCTTANYPYGDFADEDGDIFADEGGLLFSDGNTSAVTTVSEISIDGYSQNTSYFEFDSVSVDTIEVTIDNTQVANEEKSLAIFSVCQEIGTFSNFGLDQNTPAIDYNERIYRNILNKAFIRKGIESFSASIRVPYAFTQSDVTLIEALQDREDNFMVWLCGAHYGTDFFRVTAKPFRLEDLYRVQNSRNSTPSFYQGMYLTGYSNSLNVQEVV